MNNISRSLKTGAVALVILINCLLLNAQLQDTASVNMNGSKITVMNSSMLYINGSLVNKNGQINNIGNIYLTGHLNHKYSMPLFQSISVGRVTLLGNYMQNFYGDPVTFNRLIIDKTSNYLTLNQELGIYDSLSLKKGELRIQSGFVNFGTNGKLWGESETNRIIGNYGYLMAEDRLISPVKKGNIAGLGFDINPPADNFGLTTIRRYFQSQSYLANPSINRYFDMMPTNSGSANVKMYYLNADLNGIYQTSDKVNFQLWTSFYTGIPQGYKFKRQTGTADQMSNYVSANGVEIRTPGTRFTAADTICQNPPVVNFSTEPLLLCINDTVKLNAGNPECTFYWPHSGETTQEVEIRTSSFGGATADTFVVVVTDSLGCVTYAGQPILLKPLPVPDFTTPASYCQEELAVYTNTTTVSPNEPMTYEWLFSDGSTSTDVNASVTYHSAGIKTAFLTATTSSGCKAVKSKTTIINPLPVANFSPSSLGMCRTSPFTLNNTSTVSSGAIALSNWDFGDGFTSSHAGKVSEIKMYNNAGMYQVKLDVLSSGNCWASVSKLLTAYEVPQANFEASGFLYGAPTGFSNLSTIDGAINLTYSWNFGDGSPLSSEESPSHNFPTVGTYPVTLTATTPDVCISSKTQNVMITAKPGASFTYSASKYCKGTEVSFTNGSVIEGSDTLLYVWDFGDGTSSTAKNPKKTYANAGTFAVRLTTRTLPGVSDTYVQNITINPVPIPGFNAPNVCNGTGVQFINYSTLSKGVMTYQWDMADGSSSTLKNPVRNYDAVGSYDVKLVVTSEFNCKDSVNHTVKVSPVPAASFSASNTCMGNAVDFINSSSIASGSMNYTWSFGDGTQSSVFEPSKVYSGNGSYTVQLDVVSDQDCPASYTQTLQIFEKPVADFRANGVCKGNITYFINKSTISSGTLSYNWDFGEGSTSALTSPQYSYTNANSYYVTMVATSGNGCKDTSRKFIEVYPLPQPDFTYSNACEQQPVSFLNTSSIAATGTDAVLSYQWDMGDGSSEITENVQHAYTATGSYLVKLKAVSPHYCEAQVSKSITNTGKPSVNFSVADTCAGLPIRLVNLSSTPGLSWEWTFSDGTASSDSLPVKVFSASGLFNITLKGTLPQGCYQSVTRQVQVNPLPVALFTASDSICKNYQATISNSSYSPSGTLSYLWNFGDGQTTTSSSVTGHAFAQAGNFDIKLTLTNSMGCKASLVKSIHIIDAPVVDFSTDNNNPAEPVNFKNLTVWNGTGPVTYHWDFGDGATSAINGDVVHVFSTAGIYNTMLTVTSSNLCSGSVTKELLIQDSPEASFTLSGNLCRNSSLTFDNTSKVSAFETVIWAWDFGDGTSSASKSPDKTYLLAGTYTVSLTASYANGKTSTYTKQIIVDALPVAAFSTANRCSGANIAFTNHSSGFASAIYNWDFGDGTTSSGAVPTKVYSGAGTYNVSLTITSDKGCTASVSDHVQVSPSPVIGFPDSVTTCGNSLPLDAGNPGSFYHWYPGGQATRTITASANGWYKADVTDANGCQVFDSIYVKLFTPILVKLGPDRAVCAGSLLDAGIPGATYTWNNGETGRTVPVNTNGLYAVTVTDANACTGSGSVNLTVNQAPVVELGLPKISCMGNAVLLDAGNAGASFTWSNGVSTVTNAVTSSGLYSVTVTNANGCSSEDTVTVLLSAAPVVDLGTDLTICSANLPVILDAGNAGPTYQWSTGESTRSININNSGIYWAKVTSANGCSGQDTIQVTVLQTPNVPSWSDTTHACVGTPVVLDAGNAGSSYIWTNSLQTPTLSVSAAGKYGVQVTTANGCQATAYTEVIFHALPVVDLLPVLEVCDYNLPLLLTLPSGYTSYSWTGGSSSRILNVNNSGKYVGIATDQYGCQGKDSSTVIVNIPPAPVLADSTFICLGNTLQIDAGVEANTYNWSSGSNTRQTTVIKGGRYRVTVTAANGCYAKDSIWVTEYISPAVTLGPDRELCAGNAVELRAGTNANYTYLWNDNTTDMVRTVSQPGNYLVTVTDNHNCKGQGSVKITSLPAPVDVLPKTVSSCSFAWLNADNPGCTYLWSNNSTSQTINVTSSGKYIVLIQSANKCALRDTVNVTVWPLPTVTLGKDTSICQGKTLVADAKNAGSIYQWSNATYNRLASITTAGTYWVKVTDKNNCANSDTFKVTVNPVPTFVLDAEKYICAGSSYTINPGLSNVSYLWSDLSANPTLTTSLDGRYWVKATNQYNCSYTDTINIHVNTIPVVDLGTDKVVCGTIRLDAKNPGKTYRWPDNSTKQQFDVSQSGTYWVAVSDDAGCTGSDTVSITVKTAPVCKITGPTDICQGDTARLTLDTDVITFRWWDGSSNTNTRSVVQPGKYYAMAMNQNGCVSSDTLVLGVHSVPVIKLGSYKVSCGEKRVEMDAGNPGSSYEWGSTTGFISTERQVAVNKDGKYWVKVINQWGCTASDTVFIDKGTNLVNARMLFPSKVATGDSLMFINLSYPKPFKSTWEMGDGVIDTTDNPMHVYFLSGKFNVKLMVSNGVCSDAVSKPIELIKTKSARTLIPDSIKDKHESIFVNSKVYPNPTSGIFIVEVELRYMADLYIDILDMKGVRCKIEKINGGQMVHRYYDISSLPMGFYIIRIITNDEMKTIKLIKI